MKDKIYNVYSCKYNTLLYAIEDYLNNNSNTFSTNLFNIFNKVLLLVETIQKDNYARDIENNIFNKLDSYGYYDDVKNLLKGGNE